MGWFSMEPKSSREEIHQSISTPFSATITGGGQAGASAVGPIKTLRLGGAKGKGAVGASYVGPTTNLYSQETHETRVLAPTVNLATAPGAEAVTQSSPGLMGGLDWRIMLAGVVLVALVLFMRR